MNDGPAAPLSEESATAERASDQMSELDREPDREIHETLTANAPCHILDIASAADCHPITVDQTCTRLHEQGHIYPVSCGVYAVTDDGNRRSGDSSEP